jgi:hypothetical protein
MWIGRVISLFHIGGRLSPTTASLPADSRSTDGGGLGKAIGPSAALLPFRASAARPQRVRFHGFTSDRMVATHSATVNAARQAVRAIPVPPGRPAGSAVPRRAASTVAGVSPGAVQISEDPSYVDQGAHQRDRLRIGVAPLPSGRRDRIGQHRGGGREVPPMEHGSADIHGGLVPRIVYSIRSHDHSPEELP